MYAKLLWVCFERPPCASKWSSSKTVKYEHKMSGISLRVKYFSDVQPKQTEICWTIFDGLIISILRIYVLISPRKWATRTRTLFLYVFLDVKFSAICLCFDSFQVSSLTRFCTVPLVNHWEKRLYMITCFVTISITFHRI